MAWTTPRSWVTGELVTASIMNTHVRDNLTFLFDRGGPITGRINSDGTIAGGTGFTASRTALGTYTITYTTAFAAIPTVTVQTIESVTKSCAPILSSAGTGSFAVKIFDTTVANLATLLDQGFQFHATAVV